jgi:hypothetical protein
VRKKYNPPFTPGKGKDKSFGSHTFCLLAHTYLLASHLKEVSSQVCLKGRTFLALFSKITQHAYNPSTWEAETEESQVQGQPGLYSESLFQK